MPMGAGRPSSCAAMQNTGRIRKRACPTPTAKRLANDPCREGACETLSSRFARVRVRAAHRHYNLAEARPKKRQRWSRIILAQRLRWSSERR